MELIGNLSASSISVDSNAAVNSFNRFISTASSINISNNSNVEYENNCFANEFNEIPNVQFEHNGVRYEVMITVPTSYNTTSSPLPFILYIPGWAHLRDDTTSVYTGDFFQYMRTETPYVYTSKRSTQYSDTREFTNYIWATINIYVGPVPEYVNGNIFHIALQGIVTSFMSTVVTKLKVDKDRMFVIGKSIGSMSILYNIPSCCFYQFKKILLLCPGLKFLPTVPNITSLYPGYINDNQRSFQTANIGHQYNFYMRDTINTLNLTVIVPSNEEYFDSSVLQALVNFENIRNGTHTKRIITIDNTSHASLVTNVFDNLSSFEYEGVTHNLFSLL